jgi:6-phosphogluconolactonase
MQHALNSNVRIQRTRQFVPDAVELIRQAAERAVEERGLFRLGLAGGNTPKAVYEALATSSKSLPWERVQITFGDERCVPPGDSASNYRMANEALLSKVSIPEGNVFRIRGEIDPLEAAQEYEARLSAVASRFGEAIYAHDLLLLGLGEDGHTASLFPESPALLETQRWITPARGPKPPPQRVSFTFPLINAARQIAFLVNDPSKESVIQSVLQGSYPAAKVQPTSGGIVWLIGEK